MFGLPLGVACLALRPLLLLASQAAPAALPAPARVRVIVDTDIGDDIDDSWALAYLAAAPDVDLRLVVTASHGPRVRAQLLAKFLSLAGLRPPIAVGVDRRGPGAQDKVVLADWATPSDLAAYRGAVRCDGPRAIVDEVRAAAAEGAEAVIMSLAPRTNLAAALRIDPGIARRARVVGMGGSIYRSFNGTGPPIAEWNIVADPPAARALQEAAWSVATAPLDTAALGQLGPAAMRAVRAAGSPLARALLAMSEAWLPLNPWPEAVRGPLCRADYLSCSSVLYDAVGAVLAFPVHAALLKVERLPVQVHWNGTTSVAEQAPVKDWAVSWRDQAAWQREVASGIAGAPAAGPVAVAI